MAKYLSENAQAVITFLQNNPGGQFTADDLAAALGLTSRQINGTATGLQKKELIERVQIDGIEKKVIQLTAQGASIDPTMDKPED